MPLDKKTLLLVTAIVEGGLYFLGLVLMSSAQIKLRSVFSISWGATAIALLLSLPMFAALYFILRSRWEPVVQLKNEIDKKILPIFSNCKLIELAIIAFFAGVGEELFFRGWMQAVLVERTGMLIGILITSLIFGFLHYLSTAYAVYAFIMGIYLGMIYLVSGNLYIVMAIHVLYDFVALAYLFKRKLYR